MTNSGQPSGRAVVVIVVAFLAISGGSLTSLWADTTGVHEHDCDNPVTHSVHGNYGCGNIDANNKGHETVCTDEQYSVNGQLQAGDWMVCDGNAQVPGSPGGGCDFQTVQRCNGPVTHEFLAPLNPDGSYPACSHNFHVMFPGGGGAQATGCSWRDSHGATITQVCYCALSGGTVTWICE